MNITFGTLLNENLKNRLQTGDRTSFKINKFEKKKIGRQSMIVLINVYFLPYIIFMPIMLQII